MIGAGAGAASPRGMSQSVAVGAASVAEVARLMTDAGLIVITSFISPYHRDRMDAREIIGEDRFIEVFVDQEVVHSSQAAPFAIIQRSNQLKWDDLPERGKRFVALQLVTPQVMPRLTKDWQDGITAYQQMAKKK